MKAGWPLLPARTTYRTIPSIVLHVVLCCIYCRSFTPPTVLVYTYYGHSRRAGRTKNDKKYCLSMTHASTCCVVQYATILLDKGPCGIRRIIASQLPFVVTTCRSDRGHDAARLCSCAFFASLRRCPKDSFRRESGVYRCCLAQYTASFTVLASGRVFQSLHQPSKHNCINVSRA
jgi:hypothetical protein